MPRILLNLSWRHAACFSFGTAIASPAATTIDILLFGLKGFAMLWAILIGFIVGLGAKFLTPGRDPSGFFITAAIGIVGSLLATYGGQALGLYNAGEPAGFIGSVVGAVIVLAIYHLVTRKSGTAA
jgi:uncharacterized membrane protein YeaQ/YmgE (transglycosylase-associated protein family)